jgi:hypothetical protein
VGLKVGLLDAVNVQFFYSCTWEGQLDFRKWSRHVARIGEVRNKFTVLVSDLKVIDLLGGPEQMEG